jgi:hypothetical protein
MKEAQYLLRPVGIVHSSLRSREGCPKQGWEGVKILSFSLGNTVSLPYPFRISSASLEDKRSKE